MVLVGWVGETPVVVETVAVALILGAYELRNPRIKPH